MNKTQDIVLSNKYPAYILASAGTGKTELIARKVEHLIINENVDIDKIALITFTNKATAETTERIKNKLYSAWQSGNLQIRNQIDKLSLSKISTIHIFCDNIIRQYSNEIGLCANYKISNLTLEKDELANQIVKENYDENIFDVVPMYRVAKLLKELEEKASEKGLDIKLKKVAVQTFWDKLRNYFYRIYPIYCDKLEQLKQDKGIITTNDLVKFAVRILENKTIAPHIINSLEYLFLDEAQDINFDQAKLVELLISYGVKVFVVGDEKQSIYGFRGSDRKAFYHLIDFINKHKGTTYTLDVNYRSDKFMIDKINNLFSRTFKYKRNQLNFNNQNLVAAPNSTYTDKAIEIQFGEVLAETINKVAVKVENEKNPCYNDIVVLCRTNREVLKTYYHLKGKGIPVQMYLSKSIYQSKTIIDICKMFKYIVGGGLLEKEELFFTDFYVSAKTSRITEKEFYNKVENTIETFKNNGFLAALNQIIEDCNLLDFYTKTDNKQALANIQRLTEIIRDLANENLTGIEILDYLQIMILTGQDEAQPNIVQENSVTVSTIHTFKGLDSEVIIVNECDNNLNKFLFAATHYSGSEGLSFNKESIVPNTDIPNDIIFENAKHQIIIDNLEEELRLMYVLMTRARKKLILLSRKTLDKVKYQIAQNSEYVSYLRWIYNI